MSFLAIHIVTNQTVAEALSDVLFDLGALSISIEDNAAGTDAEIPLFGEPGYPAYALWEENTLTAFFDGNVDGDIIMQATMNTLEIKLTYCLESVLDTDWVRQTQSQFEPICISDRLWIMPTWHAIEKHPNRLYLVLDPGLAFGTGSHPTTRLCLHWLDSHLLAQKTVLDYGCGSGILAIAAMKLGAKEATGVDIDPQAIIASEKNTRQNNVDVDYQLADKILNRQFDLVVANILTNPLKTLAPILTQCCSPGGEILLSGILSHQVEEVLTTYQPYFDIRLQEEEEGWALLYGVRHI